MSEREKTFSSESGGMVEGRLQRVKELDSSIEVGVEIGQGSTARVYDCQKDKQARALKLSIMTEGISNDEAKALRDLGMVPGIPQLIKEYIDNRVRIAMLLEKIEGIQMNKYIMDNLDKVSAIFLKIREMINQIHQRGYLLPMDCLKDDNWIVDTEDQPHLMDLGEPRKMDNDVEEAEFQIKSDLRQFHNLIDRYIDKVSRKEKRRLQNIMLNDYYLYK